MHQSNYLPQGHEGLQDEGGVLLAGDAAEGRPDQGPPGQDGGPGWM